MDITDRIIKKYKKDRSIKDEYVLNDDEIYLINEIVQLKIGQKLPIDSVRGLLPTSKAVKEEFKVDNNWAVEDRTHAIGKRQGAFWVINTVLRNNA